MEKDLHRYRNERMNDYIYRIGKMKDYGELDMTWDSVNDVINKELGKNYGKTYWRKKFRSMDDNRKENAIAERMNKTMYNNDIYYDEDIVEVEKEKVKARDERTSINRAIRDQARKETLFDIVKKNITPYDCSPELIQPRHMRSDKSIYMLIGDIHYGMSFDNIVGVYNPEIAKERLMYYCSRVIEVARENNANTCYVSLLGDIISGLIHPTIRIENKENVVRQIKEVSELISNILFNLSANFDYVYVNSVTGNHSRALLKEEDCLTGERLDDLIPYYCMARLKENDNVVFCDNVIDSTVADFDIYGKKYVTVHGDFDKNVKDSKNRFESIYNQDIDYFISGHIHTAKVWQDDCMYITNGSVCGSGDTYTIKKRLFGSPTQTCLICSEEGVDSIHIIKL